MRQVNRQNVTMSCDDWRMPLSDALEARNDLGPKKTSVFLDGRRTTVTSVFWSYWYLAAERQAMFLRRLQGEPAPWTADSILGSYRFTNAYRASDRVSQSLLQDVIYSGSYECRDTVFRVLLFKIFNRTDTWLHLVNNVGQPTVGTFDPAAYTAALDRQVQFRRSTLLRRVHHARPSAWPRAKAR